MLDVKYPTVTFKPLSVVSFCLTDKHSLQTWKVGNVALLTNIKLQKFIDINFSEHNYPLKESHCYLLRNSFSAAVSLFSLSSSRIV